MRISIVFLAIVLAFGSTVLGQKIEGVWTVAEVTTTGENARTIQQTQPSMYLFTKKHYSIIFVSGDQPRPEIPDPGKATAAELKDVFVDRFVANAGTYELKAGKLTMKPKVAKGPGFMKPEVFSVMSVKVEGDIMTLVSERSFQGPAANPTTVKLRRIE